MNGRPRMGLYRMQWRDGVQSSLSPNGVKVQLSAHSANRRGTFHDDETNLHAMTRDRLATVVHKHPANVRKAMRRAEADGWVWKHSEGHRGAQALYHYTWPGRPIEQCPPCHAEREANREANREAKGRRPVHPKKGGAVDPPISTYVRGQVHLPAVHQINATGHGGPDPAAVASVPPGAQPGQDDNRRARPAPTVPLQRWPGRTPRPGPSVNAPTCGGDRRGFVNATAPGARRRTRGIGAMNRRALLASLDDLRARRVGRAGGGCPRAVRLSQPVAGDCERVALLRHAEAVMLALGLPLVVIGAGLLYANVDEVRLRSGHAPNASGRCGASRASAPGKGQFVRRHPTTRTAPKAAAAFLEGAPRRRHLWPPVSLPGCPNSARAGACGCVSMPDGISGRSWSFSGRVRAF